MSVQVSVSLLQGLPCRRGSASADAACAMPNIPCSVQAMLERAGVRVMLNELSSTVVFERPTEEAFVRKWQLACQVSALLWRAEASRVLFSCWGSCECSASSLRWIPLLAWHEAKPELVFRMAASTGACLHIAQPHPNALLPKSRQCSLHVASAHKPRTGAAALLNACADYGKHACVL